MMNNTPLLLVDLTINSIVNKLAFYSPFQIKNLASGEIEEVKNKILIDQLGFSKPKNKNRK